MRVLYKPKMRLIHDFSSKIRKLGRFSSYTMIPWSKMKKWVEWFVRMLVTCELTPRWCKYGRPDGVGHTPALN